MGKKVKATARKAAKREPKVRRRIGKHGDRPVVKTPGLLADIANQPQLIAVALGTIGAGVATRRGDLARGGARMLTAYLVATGLKSAIRHRVDRSPPGQEAEGARAATASHHLTDVVVGGVVGWVAEALVSAAFDRVEPAVERALGARLAA